MAAFQLRQVRSLDFSHNFFHGTFPDGAAALGAALEAFDSNCFVGPLRG